MKSLFRMAGTIVLAVLLLSCGGGVDEPEYTKGESVDHVKALTTEGCDEVLVIGGGPGIEIVPEEPPAEEPPDFVTKRVWLQTPWGTETYKFGLGENFDTKAQSANIGDGPCSPDDTVQTITGHFYLSKGYKEDVHSGDGAWRRIDSTTTQCDNLRPGDTHTETKNTVISQWITTPGIYNIVYCIDHPQDDHNNGGDHPGEAREQQLLDRSRVRSDGQSSRERPGCRLHGFWLHGAPSTGLRW